MTVYSLSEAILAVSYLLHTFFSLGVEWPFFLKDIFFHRKHTHILYGVRGKGKRCTGKHRHNTFLKTENEIQILRGLLA
jgi:hypothetical protein